MLQAEWHQHSLRVAAEIKTYAESRNCSPAQFVVAWVLNNALVSAALAGPRTESQLDDYLLALRLRLGPEDEAFVDSLVASGHPATPGYNDPAYPLEGRIVGEPLRGERALAPHAERGR